MGLAGPKKRVKLSHDPNNTTWTNDTQSFGHRMMTSQGWSPGQYLGVQNSAHSEFHTAANASHIRVAIKDDNLGLGAKTGSGVGHGECTGLDVFKNILGRLNGKDEGEIQKEIRDREDLKRAIYTERRWGSIRFVRGGLLVGDKIQDLIEGEKMRVRKLEDGKSDLSDSDSSSESEEEVASPEKNKKSKKRKSETLAEPVAEVVAVKVKKSNKTKKSKSYPEDEVSTALKKVKISKESKKDHKPKDKSEEFSAESDRKKRKREKEERRAQKAARKAKKDENKSELDSSDSSAAITKESTSVVIVSTQSSGRSTPNPMMQGRHAVRSRNIAQKRLAAMDGAALNQIFMIKG